MFDALNREWIDRQIEGGVRSPHQGRSIAVPSEHVRKTAGGKVRATDLPGRLKGAFVTDFGRGRGVWQQTKGGLRFMYSLVDSTRYSAVFPFYKVGRAFGESRWVRSFDKAIKKALATAR